MDNFISTLGKTERMANIFSKQRGMCYFDENLQNIYGQVHEAESLVTYTDVIGFMN